MRLQPHSLLLPALSLVLACAQAPDLAGPRDVDPALAVGGAPYLPGEAQTGVDLTRGTYAIQEELGDPALGHQTLAQTFTPAANGWLGYLQLPVGGCTGSTLLNVRIRDGLGGALLYEVNVAGLTSTVGPWQLLQVYDPATMGHGIRLRKDHTYAFELAAFRGSATDLVVSCGLVWGPVGNSYSGGKSYYRDLRSGTAWLPWPNGLATDDEDFPFITLVR